MILAIRSLPELICLQVNLKGCVFKLPYFLQHRLGELLATACKNYARNGGCKMSSSSAGHEHIRILEFQDGTKKSIVAYMLQENEAGQLLPRQRRS